MTHGSLALVSSVPLHLVSSVPLVSSVSLQRAYMRRRHTHTRPHAHKHANRDGRVAAQTHATHLDATHLPSSVLNMRVFVLNIPSTVFTYSF